MYQHGITTAHQTLSWQDDPTKFYTKYQFYHIKKGFICELRHITKCYPSHDIQSKN